MSLCNLSHAALVGQGHDELSLRSFFLEACYEDLIEELPGKVHDTRTWDAVATEICNQEILEGRQLPRASGQLLIELKTEQSNPNNTQTNCAFSG